MTAPQPPSPRFTPGAPLRRRPATVPHLKAGAQVTESVLRNGMRVVVAARPGGAAVASVLFFPVGARNETEREAGVSHFLEHMMFKGTANLGKGEVDRLTTLLGGQNNAFTGYDHTAYWFEFAADRWQQALDIEADRLGGLLLDPLEFDAERAVVLEELARGLDEPWQVLAQRVEGALFERHPYGRPIIGYRDTLERLTPGAMRDYYERFYHVGNATLVIAGDVAPKAVLRAVRSRFAAFRPGPGYADADCFRPAIAEPRGAVRIETHWEDAARRLMLAWPTVPVATDDDYALDLVLVILTGGRMSRLQHRLVHVEGLATSITASNDTRVESGAFWIYGECAQGADPRELERVLDEELARLAEEPVAPAELVRAKSILRSTEAFDGEAISDLAEELGEWAVDADWRMAFDRGQRHARVRARDVQRVAARLLRRERRVTGWSLPPGETLTGPAPARKPRRRTKPLRARRGKKA